MLKQQTTKIFQISFGAIIFAMASGVHAGEPSLVGTWYGHATLVDCTTRVPVAGVPILDDYRTINTGGTFIQSQAFDFNRSSGHGIWKKATPLTYSTRYNNFSFDQNANDAFSGHAEVRESVSIAKNGKTFTATAEINAYHADGSFEHTVCADVTAEKMIFD